MISLTPHDRQILELARRLGIGDGFAVPAHVPAEAHGSGSFTAEAGRHLPREHRPLAQLVGAVAWACAARPVTPAA
jgi:LuxR family quorum-sensing system transcriptional regulator CciR